MNNLNNDLTNTNSQPKENLTQPTAIHLITNNTSKNNHQTAPLPHPLAGKKVLLNTHVTFPVIRFIELLKQTGAIVSITKADELVEHRKIREKIETKYHFIPFEKIKTAEYKEHFDFVLDYGGYLASILTPSIAFVELAHVESKRYFDIDRPVYSINNSFIKRIETSLGTGAAFSNCLYKLFKNNRINIIDKNYMIFGYGKVGRGIAQALSQAGIPNNRITIVEIKDNRKDKARYDGYQSYNLINQVRAIRKKLTNIDFAVSATGISGVLSRYFTLSDFTHVTYIANMGTYDEWGRAFPTTRILNRKKPFNFILDIPTDIQFLNPTFQLAIKTCEHALKTPYINRFKVITPPKELQKSIIEKWMKETTRFHTWESIQRMVGEKFAGYNI